MKAFFVGLIFIILALLLAGLGIFLAPLLLVLGVFLRVLVYLGFIVFAIWLLGKLIIVVWEAIKGHGKDKV